MYRTARVVGLAGLILLSSVAVAPALAVESVGAFATGDAARAWNIFEGALRAILEREKSRAEASFERLVEMSPSPLRVALLADYAVQKTTLGGAVLLFEQEREAGALGAAGQKVAELLEAGREQMNQADDGFYFCQLGRFDIADANLKALLASDVDPVGLLEFTDRVPRRREILFAALNNPTVGPSIREFLKVLDRGEVLIKADPTRIRENVARLAGPPRGFENAASALSDSGEFAVPYMIEALRDHSARGLLQEAVLRALPRLERPAVKALAMALRIEDEVIQRYVAEVLGPMGYAEATPYLLALTQDPKSSTAARVAAMDALAALRQRGVTMAASARAADAFLTLAQDYYNNRSGLAADPRFDVASVWYYHDGVLQNVEVPVEIFNEVMAMRASEEALRLDPQLAQATALWIAANLRREAQLPPDKTDPTRPPNYPSALYFARAAGAEYNLMALARAIDDGDPAVALGTIEALRQIAGPASLVADGDGRLPLAEALAFPDRMVRIQAALALAGGLPTKPFRGYQNLVPALSEALTLSAAQRIAVVVEPDGASANALAGRLRDLGYEVLTGDTVHAGLSKTIGPGPGVDVIFIASDVVMPPIDAAVASVRAEYRHASVPVLIVAKSGMTPRVRELARGDHRVGVVPREPSAEELAAAIARAEKSVGQVAVTSTLAADLAGQAADALSRLALTNNPVFNVADAEPALLAALATKDESLRLKLVDALGYVGRPAAQEGIARIALDPAEPEETRIRMFAALAEAAKRRGPQLGGEVLAQVVNVAASAESLPLREAASQALGALNIRGPEASEIIRLQYRG